MEEASLESTLKRIEAALSRIETAAERKPITSGDPELEARHARLRTSVEQSLRQIDALLGAVRP